MKKKLTKSDASESKDQRKLRKLTGDTSAPTLSKKLRNKKDGESSKQGVQR